jgi:hypothetical protein
MATVNQDLVVTGPFFTQVGAGSVQVQPTGGTVGTPIALGAIAAAAGNTTYGTTGLPTRGQKIIFSDAKTVAGVPITAAAQANILGITFTPGTSLYMLTEAANNNTKTDVACWEMTLPQSYIAGKDITVNATTIAILNGGTAGTQTIAVAAYHELGDGTTSANLIATSAGTITTTAATTTYTITGTTLNPGSRLILKVTMTNQETAAGGGIVQRLYNLYLT